MPPVWILHWDLAVCHLVKVSMYDHQLYSTLSLMAFSSYPACLFTSVLQQEWHINAQVSEVHHTTC